MKEIIQAQQCTKFTFIKYPSSMDVSINEFIENFKKAFPIDYIACILHDKDIYTEDTEEHKKGDIKKTHYHFYVEFHKHQRTSSVCKFIYGEFDKENFAHTPLFKVENTSSLIKYFLHITEQAQKQHKHEYDRNDIISNNDEWVNLMLMLDSQDKKNDGEKEHEEFIQLFCDWLESDKQFKKASFIECYRKFGGKLDKKNFKWKDLIIEHNLKIDLMLSINGEFKGDK